MFNTQKFLKSIRSASLVALPCGAWITKHSMTRDKRGENSTLINVDGVKVYMDGVPND